MEIYTRRVEAKQNQESKTPRVLKWVIRRATIGNMDHVWDLKKKQLKKHNDFLLGACTDLGSAESFKKRAGAVSICTI